mmetsp:Transcript_10961/g.19361  ORF Transcript_10961/g.19361 Transcript_10961/m.19361 type:complete len:449 (-) Transcript_10961:307-1653(-)|eukprot:CAMPEP_0201870374 /NCGR_PEP_ID=MMETSP0902-20130614/3487_1 /ASSEMBLY_ACC=CAM_ASM_000551 /TAXON_ID=420261 /ORGANISM="Thalassiosira antarctica, Strain CCMP982" /LENGTH=448 /DNA_ID=CAMNT_0048395965 /DNA_START=12 /DNA_END=1358 /DNA_ORIENTATION=-
MGPRTFMAKRLTDFLLHHGNLDKHVRQIHLEHCLELPRRPTVAVPLVTLLASSADAHHAHELQLAAPHSAMILISSFVVTQHLKKEKQWKKKRQLFSHSSQKSSPLSNCIDAIPLVFASISLYLVALLVISSLIGDNLTLSLKQVHFMDRIIGISEEISRASQYPHLTRLLLEKYLFLSSLWSILISVLLTMVSTVWSILDPRIGTTKIETRSKTWRSSLDVYTTARTAAITVSVGMVLWLAYIDLPLFREAIHGEINLGLPPGLIQAFNQMLSSFFGFCIFYKFLPRDRLPPTSDSAPANEGGERITKKHACDPEIVQRMSALAREASERVQARKNSKQQLRRTHSMGDFRISSTTPSMRQSSESTMLSSLSEHPPSHEEESKSAAPVTVNYSPKSPLRDIHLAGPTLSSKDLIAKLKNNESIKRSVSSVCFISLDIPTLTEEGVTF